MGDEVTREQIDARVSACEQCQEVFGRGSMLPDACINLRMQANGSGDPWPDERVAAALNALRDRLATWAPNHGYGGWLDEAVRALVWATIVEVDAHYG